MSLYSLRNPLGSAVNRTNVMTAIFCVKVEADYGPLLCAVHNIGANIGHVPLAHTSTRVYTKVSRICKRKWSLMIGKAMKHHFNMRMRSFRVIDGGSGLTCNTEFYSFSRSGKWLPSPPSCWSGRRGPWWHRGGRGPSWSPGPQPAREAQPAFLPSAQQRWQNISDSTFSLYLILTEGHVHMYVGHC